MAKFAGKYRIESNRWQFWNYSAPAQYFITICTEHRLSIFGQISDDEMQYSVSGKMVADEIQNIPTYHQRIVLDEWVVMPNHIHLIITLGGYDYNNGLSTDQIHEFDLLPQTIDDIKQYRKQRRKMIIPKIIGKMKMQTSKRINLHRGTPGYKNWQSNYHDHVIRNEKSYWRIKNYIINNPKNWNKDKFR